MYNFYVESKMEVPNSSLNLFLGSVEILSFIVTNCIEVFLELLKYGMRQHDTCKVSIHDPLHFSIFPTAVRLLSLLSFCIAFLPPFARPYFVGPLSACRGLFLGALLPGLILWVPLGVPGAILFGLFLFSLGPS